MLMKSDAPMTPATPDDDIGTPVSVKIRERVKAARQRFHSNDNIAEFIQPGELGRARSLTIDVFHVAIALGNRGQMVNLIRISGFDPSSRRVDRSGRSVPAKNLEQRLQPTTTG